MKRYFLLSLLAAMPFLCTAQGYIGAIVGADYNWQYRSSGSSYDKHYTGRWGISAGIFGGYNFFDWLGLRADIQYAEKNYTMERQFPTLRGAQSRYLNKYLQVPVMVDFSFGGKSVRGHTYLGGYGAWWMAKKMETADVVSGQVASMSGFTKDDFRFEAGITAGLGLTWLIRAHYRIGIEAFYYLALTSAYRNQPIMNFPRYNNTLTTQVSFCYVF